MSTRPNGRRSVRPSASQHTSSAWPALFCCPPKIESFTVIPPSVIASAMLSWGNLFEYLTPRLDTQQPDYDRSDEKTASPDREDSELTCSGQDNTDDIRPDQSTNTTDRGCESAPRCAASCRIE